MTAPPGIHKVSPFDVKIAEGEWPAQTDVDHQKGRLEKEGQIEPIVVDYFTKEVVLDDPGWAYAAAQVVAARELNWPNILITFEQ
jgi:hypothetical protein